MSPANFKRCDIVIVNWNTGGLLAECLDSLRASEAFELANVIVVDNASSDNSLALADLSRVTVIRNPDNRGFGVACNQGAAAGDAPHVLFFNPDARLQPGALRQALDWLESHVAERFAACGVALLDEGGQVARACTRLPSLRMFLHESSGLARVSPRCFPSHFMTEWAHDHNREVEHIIGAFYLIRRQVFAALHGFDERFFVYLEDLDLSARIRAAGFRIQYLADVQAYHKGGGSSEKVKATRLFYSQRSKLLYARKHLGGAAATMLALFMMGVEPWVRTVFQMSKLSLQGVGQTWRAWGRLVKWVACDWPRGLTR